MNRLTPKPRADADARRIWLFGLGDRAVLITLIVVGLVVFVVGPLLGEPVASVFNLVGLLFGFLFLYIAFRFLVGSRH